MTESSDARKIVAELMAPGRGILAADESVKTMAKRFAPIATPNTPERRQDFRELLFTAPDIEQYVSGVILHDTTIRQTTDGGMPFADLLSSRGIVPGIKVDKGLVPLEHFPEETVTQGLDGLAERLAEYRLMGARFTKWRADFPISDTTPSAPCVRMDTLFLARFAALTQAADMVPIVEPEVLLHGEHSIERAAEVTKEVLTALFAALTEYRVDLGGTILKTSMVLAGDAHQKQSSPEEVADATLRVLRDVVPKELAGVVFLSGGQTPKQATENLQAMGRQGGQPWPLTFSYSRAIEEPVLATWKGEEANREAAQAALLKRLELNAAARAGKYDPAAEA